MKNRSLLTLFVLLVVAAPAIGQLPSYVPQNGLVGWWPFDSSANDMSGNNNNGTVLGATLTTGRHGNSSSAYLFNGTSDYISVPTSSSLESPAHELTLSAWVNQKGYSLVGQAFNPILNKSDNSANTFMYRFDVDINGAGFYAGTNDWTNNIGVAHPLALNQWYMLTAVLSSDSAHFYINDSLVGAQAFSTNILNNTLPLEFGRDVPGTVEVFNGTLDDIGIWNRALSSQEITQLFYADTCLAIASPSDTTICSGSVVQLHSIWPGTTCTWSPSNGLSDSTACDPLAIGLTTTTYTLTVTNGGCTATATATIHVDPGPPAPIIRQSHDTLFCNTDTSYARYQWYRNNTLIIGATDTFLVIIGTCDTWNVQVCNKDSCCIAVGINIICIGVQNEMDEKEIAVYPNPADNRLVVHGSSSKRNEVLSAAIENIYGEVIQEEKLNQGEDMPLDVSELPSGVYLLRVKTEHGTIVKRFIKE